MSTSPEAYGRTATEAIRWVKGREVELLKARVFDAGFVAEWAGMRFEGADAEGAA